MRGGGPGSAGRLSEVTGGLIGRAADLAAIQRMVGRSRLVTVTGPPGAGKTAAGTAAAAAMREAFADGAWRVGLDALRDETRLPRVVAEELGLPGDVASGGLEAVTAALRDRRLLLILDPCEHLVGGCAALAARLQACPGVRILAISRESLRVAGGLTVTISPLPLRDALALFERRAAATAPGFRITPRNRQAVAAICQRLDRLPLGIELAARQVAATPVDRLEARLQIGYGFLRNDRHAPARHQTLHAAIDWSYQLCTRTEQLLWARLSVFGRPFGLRDAQEVCADGALPAKAVAAGVVTLAARSIVLMSFPPDGDTRFWLPATHRAFGATRLRARGAEPRWQRRYQAWQHARQDQAASP
jgi:predicted ATPase